MLGWGAAGSCGEVCPCWPAEGPGEVTPLLKLEIEEVGVSRELGVVM